MVYQRDCDWETRRYDYYLLSLSRALPLQRDEQSDGPSSVPRLRKSFLLSDPIEEVIERNVRERRPRLCASRVKYLTNFSNENYSYLQASSDLLSPSFFQSIQVERVRKRNTIDPLKPVIYSLREQRAELISIGKIIRSVADDHSNRNFLLRNARSRGQMISGCTIYEELVNRSDTIEHFAKAGEWMRKGEEKGRALRAFSIKMQTREDA